MLSKFSANRKPISKHSTVRPKHPPNTPHLISKPSNSGHSTYRIPPQQKDTLHFRFQITSDECYSWLVWAPKVPGGCVNFSTPYFCDTCHWFLGKQTGPQPLRKLVSKAAGEEIFRKRFLWDWDLISIRKLSWRNALQEIESSDK